MIRVRMLFWEESKDAQGEVGSFVLRGRKIEIEPVTPDGYDVLSQILSRSLRIEHGGRIRAAEDPERWIRALPMNYDGAQVRAELEES